MSVIIPNYNAPALLRLCLASLTQQSYTQREVIVVDNASTDDSVRAVCDEFDGVRLLALDENRGYAGGCNAGYEAARGDVIAFFNNDAEADALWLEELVAALRRHPRAGSVASRVMLHSRPSIMNAAGDVYRRNGTADSRGVWQPYGPPFDEECYVFGASGAAVAYRRETLEDIGLFEERFFMYCEDVDLAWRAQLAGWKCVYAPRAVVYHRLSATAGGPLASYHVGRNTIWVIARNYPPALLRRHRREVVGAQLRIAWDALRAWRGEAARARLRGQLAGLLTWHTWRQRRRDLPDTMRVGEAYLESIME